MIQFQVDQGEADVIVLLVGDRRVSGGPGPAATELARLGVAALGPAPSATRQTARSMPISAMGST